MSDQLVGPAGQKLVAAEAESPTSSPASPSSIFASYAAGSLSAPATPSGSQSVAAKVGLARRKWTLRRAVASSLSMPEDSDEMQHELLRQTKVNVASAASKLHFHHLGDAPEGNVALDGASPGLVNRLGYHPAYERGSRFADASMVRVVLAPITLTSASQQQERKEEVNAHVPASDVIMRGDSDSDSDSDDGYGSDEVMSPNPSATLEGFEAVASVLEKQKEMTLADLFEDYSAYKESVLKRGAAKDEEKEDKRTPLPNLNWNQNKVRMKYQMQRDIQLAVEEVRGGGVQFIERKDESSDDDFSDGFTSQDGQWNGLRVYLQPLLTVGIVRMSDIAKRKNLLKRESFLNGLFSELSGRFQSILFAILPFDDSAVVPSLSNSYSENHQLKWYIQQNKAFNRKSENKYTEIRSNLEMVMPRLSARLVFWVEEWLLQASPASLNITTPIDVILSAEAAIKSEPEPNTKSTSNIGRLRKELGDYCLCMGSPDDALVHYAVALDISKECDDILWHAAALEGACAADVCAFLGGLESHRGARKRAIKPSKVAQLWLSVRQACEQASALYHGLPSLKNGVLLKLAEFGCQLISHCPTEYTKREIVTQIERYMEAAIDTIPDLKKTAGKSACAFCLHDAANIYLKINKRRKAAYLMLMSASSLTDEHASWALLSTLSAGHMYGLENDATHSLRILKSLLLEPGDCLSTENLPSVPHLCKWPMILQTVQLGIVSLGLAHANHLQVARAAFYFLVLYQTLGPKSFRLDKKSWIWVFKCISQVQKGLSAGLENVHISSVSIGQEEAIYEEQKYSLKFAEHFRLADNSISECDEKELEQGKLTHKRKTSAFLYAPFEEQASAAEENSVGSVLMVPVGEKVVVDVVLFNPFPLGLLLWCQVCAEHVDDDASLEDVISFSRAVKLQAFSRKVCSFHLLPHQKGELRVTGCRFRLGQFGWFQNWIGKPEKAAIKVIDELPLLKLSASGGTGNHKRVEVANISEAAVEKMRCSLQNPASDIDRGIDLGGIEDILNKDVLSHLPISCGQSYTFPSFLQTEHHMSSSGGTSGVEMVGRIVAVDIVLNYVGSSGKVSRQLRQHVYCQCSLPLEVVTASASSIVRTLGGKCNDTGGWETEHVCDAMVVLLLKNASAFPITATFTFSKTKIRSNQGSDTRDDGMLKSTSATVDQLASRKVAITVPHFLIPQLIGRSKYEIAQDVSSLFSVDVSHIADNASAPFSTSAGIQSLRNSVLGQIASMEYFPLRLSSRTDCSQCSLSPGKSSSSQCKEFSVDVSVENISQSPVLVSLVFADDYETHSSGIRGSGIVLCGVSGVHGVRVDASGGSYHHKVVAMSCEPGGGEPSHPVAGDGNLSLPVRVTAHVMLDGDGQSAPAVSKTFRLPLC